MVSLQATVTETVFSVISIVNFVYSSPLISKMFFDNLLQFWEGTSRFFNPSIISALLRSSNSRRVLKQSLPANLIIYMGTVLFYEAGMKPLIRSNIPDIKESYPEQVMDIMMTVYITRLALSMFIDNTIYNMLISKASSECGSDVIQSCGCGTTALIQASLASPFYYLGNIAAIHVISSSMPIVGVYLKFLLRSLLYGQCFVEYKLGTAGLCTVHRYNELIKNNSYCFGLGLSFLTTLYLCNCVIDKTSNAQSFFIDDALFCLLFQHYIMLAQLMDKPLPGDKIGVDVFYHSRLIVESVLKQVNDWLIPHLRNPVTRGRLEKCLQKVNGFPPLRLIKTIFLEKNLQSSKEFMHRPAVELFFDTYGETIQTAIAEIRKLRETPSIKRLQALSPYLPNFILSQEVRNTLNIILTENLDQMLSRIDDFTTIARIKVIIYDKERISEINSELNQEFLRPFVPLELDTHPLISKISPKLSQDDFQMIPKDENKDSSENISDAITSLMIIEDYSGVPTNESAQKINQRRKKKIKSSNTTLSESSHASQNNLFLANTIKPSPTTKPKKALLWRARQ